MQIEKIHVYLFTSPHEFCQVCSMHASMYTISGHADLCMMPITFDRVSTGSIGYIHELLTVIYSNVCLSQFTQLVVRFPAVTVYYRAWLNPFLD